MPLIMTCQDNQQSNAARRILLHELLMASTLWPIFPPALMDCRHGMSHCLDIRYHANPDSHEPGDSRLWQLGHRQNSTWAHR